MKDQEEETDLIQATDSLEEIEEEMTQKTTSLTLLYILVNLDQELMKMTLNKSLIDLEQFQTLT